MTELIKKITTEPQRKKSREIDKWEKGKWLNNKEKILPICIQFSF